MDVRVTARAIDLVVQSFARTALASAPCDVLRANLVLVHAETAWSCRWSWLVSDREATMVCGDIRVSTTAVSVVHFGAACRC